MLGALGNLGSLFKQAQKLEGQLTGLGEELRALRATGLAGGGLVEIDVNGLQEVLQCRIDPSLFGGGDRELVEELVRAAANDALHKARRMHADSMRNMAMRSGIPGLDQAISRLAGQGGGIPGSEGDAIVGPENTIDPGFKGA